MSYTNDAGYYPIWLTAKFQILLVHLMERYENGGRQKATSFSDKVIGKRKTPRRRWWWWLLKGEGKWHSWDPWEEGKESPERLCSEGGTLAKEEELPSRGTGLLTLSPILYGQRGGEKEGRRERKEPLKSLLQNFATTSPSLSTSYRDTMMKNCLSIEWTLLLQCR